MTDPTALLVTAHGTPTSLDDLPGFLQNIRRGRPAPADVIDEVRRRYEAIGGISPLAQITRAQADALGARVGLPSRMAMRLWHPYILDAVRDLAAQGIARIVSVPIAPYSVHVYHDAVAGAVEQVGAPLEVVRVPAWNREPALIDALASEIDAAVSLVPAGVRALVVMSAHSLPMRVVEGGDPYARLVQETAADVANAMRARVPHRLAFQSQGMTQDAWLGPDLPTTFRIARDEGFGHVVVAPIGFLADHVEVLYDVDIEAQKLARDTGLTLSRTRTLNDDPRLIDALTSAVQRVLASESAPRT